MPHTVNYTNDTKNGKQHVFNQDILVVGINININIYILIIMYIYIMFFIYLHLFAYKKSMLFLPAISVS